MQGAQISGVLERAAIVFVTMLLGWLVKRGWIGESDVATLLPAIILLPSLAYGWWINRPKALVQAAATVAGTVVFTTPALATATPNEENIIATNASAAAITAAVVDAKAERIP